MPTRIESVNEILRSIQAPPISSLDGPLDDDAAIAVATLNEIQADVLSHGWDFNILKDVERTPVNGEITLAGVKRFRISPRSMSSSHHYVNRNGRLFDSVGATYTITTPVRFDEIVIDVDWDEIPQIVQRYITMRAARVTTGRVTNNSDLLRTVGYEEMEVLTTVRRDHSIQQRLTMLDAPGIREALVSYPSGGVRITDALG
jgi:hypothetical protein